MFNAVREIIEEKNNMVTTVCTAYVICCNDVVEYVVVNDENLAKEEMAKRKIAYFEKNKWYFKDEESYDTQCYWHIHVVNGTYAYRG
jgi:hypothetical protein